MLLLPIYISKTADLVNKIRMPRYFLVLFNLMSPPGMEEELLNEPIGFFFFLFDK